MEQFIEEIMNTYGYLGVAFLIALENLFPPIPSEVILTFGGFMTTRSGLTVLGMIVASTIGAVVGGSILYYLGRFIRPEVLKKLVRGRIGRILRLKEKDVDMAMRWFEKHGIATIFFARFIPIVRSLISIPAGTMKVPFGLFLIFTTLGTATWNTILILLGAWAGENWSALLGYLDTYKYIIIGFVAIIILPFIVKFYRHRA